MSAPAAACDHEALERYWLGDLDDTTSEEVESHLFDCGECAAWLEELAALQIGLRDLLESGELLATTSRSVLEHAVRSGLRLRSYRIPPGGTVHCTIAPDEDANVVHLAGPFPAEGRLDVRITRIERGATVSSTLAADVAVDRAGGEIVLLNPGEAIRSLPLSTFHVDVLALAEDGQEQLFGRYTLEHSPWPSEEPAP